MGSVRKEKDGNKNEKETVLCAIFLLYVVVVAFVLYLNGVFTGEWEASVNLIINVGFC